VIQARLAIAAGVLLAGAGIGWTVRDWRADADALEAAQAHAQVLAANALETERRLARQQEAAHAADKMRRAAAADAAAVRDVAERLRKYAAALGAACGAPTAPDSPASGSAGPVLADMLGRAVSAAQELAAVADERGAALSECAGRYDALRPPAGPAE
jgi:hypothetical protein